MQISGQTKTVIVFQLKCFKTVHDNKEGLWLSLVCIFIWTVLAQSFLDLVSIKVCFSNTIFLAKNFHMFTIKKRDFLQYEAACLSSSYPLSYALRAWSLWTNETPKSTNKTWQHLTLSKHAGKWNNALQWATLYRCNPNECRMALGLLCLQKQNLLHPSGSFLALLSLLAASKPCSQHISGVAALQMS